MRQHNPEFFKPDIEVHKVKRIEFGILKPEDIAKMAVVKVTEKLVYGPNGEPLRQGLNDPAMGPSSGRDECQTCKGTSTQCPGHFGYIELVKPMFHVGYIEKVVRVLHCVCYKCSKLLCDEAACMIKSGKKRFAMIHSICSKIRECRRGETKKRGAKGEERSFNHDGCGAKQPLRYLLQDKITIQVEFEDEPDAGGDRKRPMLADEVLSILKSISSADSETMGFDPTRARPDWMIVQNLPVAPPAVRPTITMDSTLKQDDDLTYQYRQIVKINQELTKNGARSKPSHTYSDSLRLLQFYVATLVNNELPGIPISAHKSGKRIKALRARLRGKEGRLRQNLMGKRVDFSARSVITPDPNLSLDQLGVPRTIAMNMTIPEVVNPLNIEHLRRLVENGPSEWPGANYIIRDNKTILSLSSSKKLTDVHLEYGYIVERHLMDDDFVIFNRQPSLHKMSMMGHRIKILPYSSFRLNLSVTTPYNADFDGDEMNMHVPQSYETKAEIKEIMHVPRQIVSPQSNRPVMGIVQDTLTGMRIITSKDTYIEKDILMNLLMSIDDFDGRIPTPPKTLWTGKQLISLILPDVNLEKTSSTHNTQFKYQTPINAMDTLVLIQRGQLLMGGLCKRTVGNAAGGLVHIIWSDFGPDRCRRFLSTAQRTVNSWLVYHGFTVGIADTISDEDTSREIGKILRDAMGKVANTMHDAQEGKLECQPGKNMLESFEAKINFDLNDACNSAGNLAMKSLSGANNVKMMVMSGAKGSNINISQIMSCVGQQNVEGKRIPFGFQNRTLPHFTKDDYGPQSRGFVLNSYLSGLTPQEFYFHAMGGREGLIDTAVKTSETGYIQRRLIKSLEDVMARYDGTVRNSMGYILQFLYGEDGMSGEYIEDQTISILGKSDADMKRLYQLIDPSKDVLDELAELKRHIEPSIVEQIADNMEMQVMIQKCYDELVRYRNELRKDVFKPNDDKQHLPVNLDRLITTAKRKFNLENMKISDLSPCTIIEELEKLVKRLIVVRGEDRVSVEAQLNGTKLFTIHLKTELAPKKLIFADHFNKVAFDWLIGEIESRFNQSIVAPGEMVGAIAAQSIGEPATQMTLNTFHYAGVSSKNVTLGVPRLKEVINVAKTIRTPSMSIYLRPEISSDQTRAKKIQSQLEHTTLGQAANAVQILYDPNPRSTVVTEDADFLNLYYEMEEESAADRVSPWVLRIELNNDKMTDKDLRMSEIQRKIRESYDTKLEVIASDDNADRLVLRIRIAKQNEALDKPKDSYAIMSELRLLQNSIMNDLLIKGIPEIKKVYMRKVRKPTYDAYGKLMTDKEEWLLETDGVNLKQVLNHEGIDHTRTYSNNVIEISEVLGIEAVRQAILRELRSVLNHYSIYVNYRHLAILADLMTHHGKLTSITRHGINRVNSEPLRRCSFEETVEILLEAAVFAEVDHIKGVTENIIIGQLCPLGTGCFDVLIDKSALNQAKHINDMNEVARMEDEDEGLSTPMQPSEAANTPYYMTPEYSKAGMAPATPNTPYSDPGKGFSPSYPSAIASPSYPYPVSPSYISDYQKPQAEKYSPASPPHGNSPLYPSAEVISSPGYSPVHAGDYSPNEGYSPAPAGQGGYSPAAGRTGAGMMLSAAVRSRLSPMYSPSESPSNPSYSPIVGAGSAPYSGNGASPRPGSGSGIQYAPNSPMYNPNSPAYYAVSPPYNPSSPIYMPNITAVDQDEPSDQTKEGGNPPAKKEETAKEAKKQE